MQQQHATGPSGATRRNQVVVGLTLLHEQFPLPQLVELGMLAEQAGFAAIWADNHFEPWQDNLGHCGLASLTLAALGQRTQRLPARARASPAHPIAIVRKSSRRRKALFPPSLKRLVEHLHKDGVAFRQKNYREAILKNFDTYVDESTVCLHA